MKELLKTVCILTLFIVSLACSNSSDSVNEIEKDSQDQMLDVDTTGLLLNIDSLHVRRNLNTYDLSLLEYIKSNPNRPDSTRNVIYIIPFGNMKSSVEEIVKNEAEYLKVFFQLEVKILNRISYDSIQKIKSIKTRLVPHSDYQHYSKIKGDIESFREQIEATSFMENYLIPNKPDDAIAFLGITEHDIYNPKYNYLFGASKLNDGVGVVSVFRLISYNQSTKFNIRKVTSKQIANMFSIKNVKDYECLLNFHNSKEELESGSFYISPRALEKLKYNIGFDYNKRFKDLHDFWTNDEPEANYWGRIMTDYYSSVKLD